MLPGVSETAVSKRVRTFQPPNLLKMPALVAGHLLLGLWCLSPAAAHQHAHQHAQHHRQQHPHQRHEPNLSSSLHNPSGSLHNHTALPTWTSHLPRLLVLSASIQAAHGPEETGSLRGALVSTCRCLASGALRALQRQPLCVRGRWSGEE